MGLAISPRVVLSFRFRVEVTTGDAAVICIGISQSAARGWFYCTQSQLCIFPKSPLISSGVFTSWLLPTLIGLVYGSSGRGGGLVPTPSAVWPALWVALNGAINSAVIIALRSCVLIAMVAVAISALARGFGDLVAQLSALVAALGGGGLTSPPSRALGGGLGPAAALSGVGSTIVTILLICGSSGGGSGGWCRSGQLCWLGLHTIPCLGGAWPAPFRCGLRSSVLVAAVVWRIDYGFTSTRTYFRLVR
jgi:hypothetical protein